MVKLGDKVKYDLKRLNSNIDSSININEDYEFSKDEISGTDLINLNCHIEGSITKNSLNNYHINLNISGLMILPCAITLKEVEYPFDIDIDNDIDELLDNVNYTNSIDISPIVWESILMEIPMRVVSEDAKDYQISGDGWNFTTEENEKTSSPFDELKDLL